MRCRFRAAIRESDVLHSERWQAPASSTCLKPSRGGAAKSSPVHPFLAVCPRQDISEIFLKEQKFESEVLGVIEAGHDEAGARKRRVCGYEASSGMWTHDNTIKQSFVMKSKQSFVMKFKSRHDHFSVGAVAPEESRFEKFETGFFFETSAYAHLSRKLQKIFPLPPECSEPEDVRILLITIQEKLSKFPVPGEG
jgi:hypothetical protein